MIELELPRRATIDEATLMVGDKVPAREPSILAPGTVVRDADTGDAVLGYMKLPDPGRLRRAVLAIDCGSGTQRNNNYRSKSRTFGFSPRRPVTRREACSMTTTGRDHPEIERVLESYADVLSDMLGEIDPALVDQGLRELVAVKPEWRLGETKLWTSGVINDTAQLPYHRDGFNFPTWSAMPVVRRGTRGGRLHLPEYDLVVPCDDSTVTLFQGSKYVHGVTPITRLKKQQGYRVSVVYYALRGMKNCYDAAAEAAYGRKRRTERETEMARRLAAGDRGIPGNVDPRGAVKRMQQRPDGHGVAWSG